MFSFTIFTVYFESMKNTSPLIVLMSMALTIVFSLLAASCKKEQFLTQGGSVMFSADTLMFDTVFTQQGSATRSIKIYNNEKQKIKISSIRLKRGDESPFRLNVNGVPGKEINDIELAAEDSMYVFAAVTIDPTLENTPFLIEDQLVLSLNGQDFSIPVIAFGQNVHYVVDSVLQTQTWTNDKPYVIINSALVDENAILTIPAGVRVYMHANSRLFVMGTLKINGTKSDSVIFQGDRIDRNVYVGEYADVPGEWGGLYFFKQSQNNEINYAILKNGGLPTIISGQQTLGAMIQLDPDTIQNGIPKLKLTNTVIKNSVQYGIIAFNSSLYADNCLVVDCQFENLALVQGGDYTFNNSTIATYGAIPYFSRVSGHITAVVQNYFYISQDQYYSSPLQFTLTNSIIYGPSGEDEFYTDRKEDYPATVSLNHSLLKAAATQAAFVNINNCIFNQDPDFRGVDSSDYHLSAGSPAINNGISAGSFSTDLDGVPRSNPPDIGCYQYLP